MAYEVITPNMGLIVPSVGQTSGPQYALDINNTLTLIDQHNHTPGSGVAITPLAININSDLTFVGNNATHLRSTRFDAQSVGLTLPSDKGCIYVLGVDLYYNDEAGNVIRLTQGGSIVGTAGSITGLVSPASASYSAISTTFIFQSDINTSANIDVGSVVLRNITANSDGLTLSAPASLSSNYSLVLPVLPPSIDMMVLDTSGNITSALVGPALQLTHTGTSGEPYTIDVAAAGVTQAYLAPRTVVGNGGTAPVGGVAISGSLNGVITNALNTINLGSAVLVCTGRPVQLKMTPIANNTGSGVYYSAQLSGTAHIVIVRDSTNIIDTVLGGHGFLSFNGSFMSIDWIDFGALSGTHTYTIYIVTEGIDGSSIAVNNMILTAFEIN